MQQNIVVRLALQGMGAFKTQMAQASASVKGFHDDAQRAASNSASQTRKAGLAMAGIGVAAVAAAAASAKAAASLETRMQNVATIWTDASVTIAEAGNRVVEMSQELPQSANNLAEGLYDIASSGFQGAAGLEVLSVSAKAASAGLTSTGTAAKGITAVLNAYGLTADSAATVSDVLFQTVNLGVVTFEELSSQLGDFVGSAAVANINIRDSATAFATMTLNGISAAEAGTSMNRVIQTLIQPGEELAATLKAMGYESGVAALEAVGLQGVMTGLVKQTGGGAEAMSGLFTEIRSLRGALALTSNAGENYARVAAIMNDESKLLGATQAALDEQSKSTSYQFQILKNSIVAAAIDFGQALLPAMKLVVGIFQTAIDLWNEAPGPLKIIVGIAGGLAVTIVSLTGAFLLLAPSLSAASGGMAALTAGFAAAATGARGLLAAMGPVGWIAAGIGAGLTVLTGIWAGHAKGQADAKRRVDELAESLDAQTHKITDQTSELLRQRVIDDDLDKKAKQLGVTLETLMLAMTGDKKATEEMNAAAERQVEILRQQYIEADKTDGSYTGMTEATYKAWKAWQDAEKAQGKLNDGVEKSTDELGKAADQSKRDAEAKKAATSVTDQLTKATTEKAEADRMAAEAAEKHRQEMDALRESINKGYDVTDALTAQEDAYEASQTTITDTLEREAEARIEAQREANDRAFEAEREALDRTQEARREALDEYHEDIKEANERRFEEENRALEAEHRVRKNALDDQQRARKQALDDVFREERRQLDRRLDLLDEEWDKRRRAEEKAYEAQKEEAEFMIRTTWGAERQAWIDRLGVIEEGHEATVREIDRAQEDEANALKDGQEDSEEARENGLADQFRVEREGLADILEEEKRHLKDRQDAIDLAEQDRYDSAVAHHEDMVRAEDKGLDDRIKAAEKKLDDLQTLENTKADQRRSAAKTKRDQTLADAIAALEQNNKDQETKLENLRIIWERAGRNLSTEMLEELQGLEPGMIAQLAKAGPAGFDAFMGALETSVKGVTPEKMSSTFSKFNEEIQGLLQRVGEYGGVHLMEFMAGGLSNDPQGAQKLRDKLLELIAPKEVSPGVWAQPKPGGGYYPTTMSMMADGGVYRQAQISRTPILWAEAGPEAYIPLGQSKRQRSEMLLGDVATLFGYGLVRMANGGIVGSSGGTTYSNANHVTVNVSVAAGVDPDAVGHAVRREVGRAFDSLNRQVAVRAWRN